MLLGPVALENLLPHDHAPSLIATFAEWGQVMDRGAGEVCQLTSQLFTPARIATDLAVADVCSEPIFIR